MSFEFDLTITLSLIASAGAMLFAWIRTRKKDLEERLREGNKRMDRHDNRISALEQTVNSMPGKEDIHQLQLHMMQVSGDLKAMRATMEGDHQIMRRLEAIVSRHEDHLLDGGGKR